MRRNDESKVSSKTEVVLALGSNIGNRNDYLDQAICALESLIGPLQESSRWVSDPILQEPHDANADAGNLDVEQAQDQYINMVVIGSTQLSPLSLLAETQKIEESLGRPARHGFHTPRTIDIDLIAIGSTQVCSVVLTLPHKEAMNRLFVLLPLAELRPDYCFAMQTKPIAQLITQAPQISINPQSTEAR